MFIPIPVCVVVAVLMVVVVGVQFLFDRALAQGKQEWVDLYIEDKAKWEQRVNDEEASRCRVIRLLAIVHET